MKYTLAKIVVDKKELEEIRDNITSLLQTGNNYTIRVLEPIYGSYDLNEKEHLIVDYLNKNPGHLKEQVVSGCERYSRMTVLKTINGLVAKGFIIKREDKIKHRTYHLFVNHQDVAISFEKDLQAFKHFYTSLIGFISQDLMKSSNNKNNKSKHDNLIRAILGPYKHLYMMYITSDLLLWNKRPLDNDTLHRKFSVFFKIMKEILVKLIKLFPDNKSNQITNQLLTDNSYGLSELHILHILKTFDEYGLSDYAEPVVDVLWKLSYPILPLIYPSQYKKHFRDGTLKDWRKLFNDKPEPEYKPKYDMLPFD